MRLQPSSPESLPAIERDEISLYKGELTTAVVVDSVAKIKKAFEENKVQVLQYELDSPKGIKKFEGRFSTISKDEILLVVRVLE